MNRREVILIQRHVVASRRYRMAVLELERRRRFGHHRSFDQFYDEVVIPARENCYRIFRRWCNEYAPNKGRNDGHDSA